MIYQTFVDNKRFSRYHYCCYCCPQSHCYYLLIRCLSLTILFHHYYHEQDEVTGEKYFQNKCELLLPGVCTDMEICGVSRLAKSFIAIANSDQISLVDVETNVSDASMRYTHSLQSTKGCSYSSLSFYNENELLAGANDAGNVTIFDLYTGQELRSFCADSCGINKIEFNKSGQLITCGMGTNAQLHVWDIRSSFGSNNTNPSLSSQPPNSNPNPNPSPTPSVNISAIRSIKHPNPNPNPNPYYTSLSSHSLYNKIICGTNKVRVKVRVRVKARVRYRVRVRVRVTVRV
jgi:WD40 repeat protein